MKNPKIGINDLESQFPEIAKEFHTSKNGNLKPSDFFAHSNKKVWWLCPKGHEYLMGINKKTGSKKRECPICSGHSVITGINDLFTTNPELKERWDYEKNINLNPLKLTAGTPKFAFWKCDKGHSFKARIYNMAHSREGKNCPFCRNFKVIPGENDLKTLYPSLANEWDEEKNGFPASEVNPGNNKYFWWKCKKGHSWRAILNSRVKGKGCPICKNKKLLIGYNDLATISPEILNFWDYKKNQILPSQIIGSISEKKVWLKCNLGHSYKARLSSFLRGSRCPICAGKTVLKGFNDLATTHPNLINEWDYLKNIELTPDKVSAGMNKRVWWICKNGHSWKATINRRHSGSNCPICTQDLHYSIPEKAIFYYISSYFSDAIENIHLKILNNMELDIYIPSLKIGIEYDGEHWHQDTKRDIKKDQLCKKSGIKLIRIRENGCPEFKYESIVIKTNEYHNNVKNLREPINKLIQTINEKFNLVLGKINISDDDVLNINNLYLRSEKNNSFINTNPNLALEWDYEKNGSLKPNIFTSGSDVKIWWKCKKNHSWLATISSRVAGKGCPYCSNRKVLKGYNDLETKFPSIAKEWDYEKNYPLIPSEVSYVSTKKAYWKCKNGHSFQSVIVSRTRLKTNCPYCAGLNAIDGVNDLKTFYPELLEFWDYEKNGTISPQNVKPGSEKVVYWKCKNGHSYKRQIASQVKANGKCPICTNRILLKGFNDLNTLRPDLANEWDYTRNENLKPEDVKGTSGNHKRIWWKCKKGHSWNAEISARINFNSGCPICGIEKSKITKRNKKTI